MRDTNVQAALPLPTFTAQGPVTPLPAPERVKCLLVDDIEENLTALEALLQCDGVEILKAGSGPEALELLLQHNDVALALLDVQMPDMNGFERRRGLSLQARGRPCPDQQGQCVL